MFEAVLPPAGCKTCTHDQITAADCVLAAGLERMLPPALQASAVQSILRGVSTRSQATCSPVLSSPKHSPMHHSKGIDHMFVFHGCMYTCMFVFNVRMKCVRQQGTKCSQKKTRFWHLFLLPVGTKSPWETSRATAF